MILHRNRIKEQYLFNYDERIRKAWSHLYDRILIMNNQKPTVPWAKLYLTWKIVLLHEI